MSHTIRIRRHPGSNYVIEYHDARLSTGKHDANGQEIFEGDVVEAIDIDGLTVRGVVEWESNSFLSRLYVRQIPEEDRGFEDEMGPLISWQKMNIIGNTTENQELLEGGQK